MIKPEVAPKPKAEEIPENFSNCKRSSSFFFTIIYFNSFSVRNDIAGIATPAEAAAIGAFGALVMAFFYKTLKWESFRESVF